VPSLWTPQFDPTQHKVELPDLEEPKTDHFLRSVLQRKHQPLSTPLNLQLEFHGLFAVPEQWKAKVDDPAEAAYSLDFRFVNFYMKGAKIVGREMTEEERAETDAAKGRKGTVDQKPKGKGKGDEEPTEEEVQQLKAEIKEREERNYRLKVEWEGLDENTKFFRTCEDPYKNASIRCVDPVDASLEDASPRNTQAYDLEEAQLREFES